ncbi:glycoside hydrolase family 15 protein [Moniliophthora roreri]|nr:glycoside hydrolase family 15 protein [Moniliophthora roreri]
MSLEGSAICILLLWLALMAPLRAIASQTLIHPRSLLASSIKTRVLQTKFMNEMAVVSVTDFLPRQPKGLGSATKPLLHWLIRRVEVIRGGMPLMMECAPAFNYARSSHRTSIIDDNSTLSPQKKALFESNELALDLRYVTDTSLDNVSEPEISLQLLDLSARGHKGPGVYAKLDLSEGQVVTFVLRTPPNDAREVKGSVIVPIGSSTKSRPIDDPFLTKELVSGLLTSTNKYWLEWIRQSSYSGSWKEAVHRSAFALKLLIYEPTGAVVASPTFSLPEYIGGTRNCASWIRDSSFTLYALIRLGFTTEANGGKDLEEIELTHLDGHKGSKPVRIGNGAADHLQLVSTTNKSEHQSDRGACRCRISMVNCKIILFGKPLSYDDWVLVREFVVPNTARSDVVANCKNPDLCAPCSQLVESTADLATDLFGKLTRNSEQVSVLTTEQGGEEQEETFHGEATIPVNNTCCPNLTRVAIDRGLRLADKRSLPCPNRNKWLEARDLLYEEIMEKAWNKELKYFGQSYDENEVLDSAVLIMPLVFFMQGSDPRFMSTLRKILHSPERGGLTSNNLVYRYDTNKSDDGVGGEEGTFCLCTLWCVEALTRAGEYDRTMLAKAVNMFEEFLLYLNHVGLCTEEISQAGEGLGNAVQGFTCFKFDYYRPMYLWSPNMNVYVEIGRGVAVILDVALSGPGGPALPR